MKFSYLFFFIGVSLLIGNYSITYGKSYLPAGDLFPILQDQTLEQHLDAIYEFREEKKYDVAIENLSDLIIDAKNLNDYTYVFHGYNLLSVIYDEINDTIPALAYAKSALEFAKQSKNDTLISWGYNNLAASLADNPATRMQALEYYKQSLEIQQRLNTGVFLDAALNIAELYGKEGNYVMMYPYLKKATASYDHSYEYYNDPIIYLDMTWGDYYKGLHVPSKALEHYAEAYERIERDNKTSLALEFYENYALFLKEQNYNDRAFEVQQQYLKHYKLREKTLETETLKLALARAETEELRRQRNDAEMKQQLLDHDLQRKKIQFILLGSILGLLSLFLAYLFYSEKLRLGLINNLKRNNKNLLKAKNLAEKSERAKSKFFSTLSHEMRTPLYGVTGIISLLEKRKEFEAFKEEIGSLKFSADHLLDIINDLLDLSKLEDESFSLINKRFNVKLLAEDLISSFDQNSLKNAACTLKCVIDSSVPDYIIGDARRISQVLVNILGNALKFTPKGNIILRLRSEDLGANRCRIHFEVQDDGIGIPKERQELIFDEFSQLEQLQNEETATDLKGTGLGLPIVRKILEKMDSEIYLKSAVGKGSTFMFSIDFEKTLSTSKTSTNEISGNSLKVKSLKGLRCLIVDDNKINRLVTKRVLENLEIITFEAQNGEEALERAKKHHFDFILMDINMPGMNGYETTQAIRIFDKHIPIIALTAAEASFITKTAQNSGMNDIVTKPYNVDDLSSTISKHVQIRNLIASF
ncbi:response regulator [Leeuwenhoekiella sp. MAR_2009_132]|uniref:tetratricopeptide repeat-containing hybrid sensor histidine kinase/response regulator n=1 Tax=Leeuwenhoekiella sp. MAR_2009_132 TaxID=1392489 RepID=UPI00048DF945|nr:response regulator [Leeuwenhoekiella sp. MAR_2009_132]